MRELYPHSHTRAREGSLAWCTLQLLNKRAEIIFSFFFFLLLLLLFFPLECNNYWKRSAFPFLSSSRVVPPPHPSLPENHSLWRISPCCQTQKERFKVCLGETAFLLSPLASLLGRNRFGSRAKAANSLKEEEIPRDCCNLRTQEERSREGKKGEIVLFLKSQVQKMTSSVLSGPHQISPGRQRRLRAMEGLPRHGAARRRGLHGI